MTLDIPFEIKDALYYYNKPASWQEIKRRIDEYHNIKIESPIIFYNLKKMVENGEVIRQTIGEELYYSLSDEQS